MKQIPDYSRKVITHNKSKETEFYYWNRILRDLRQFSQKICLLFVFMHIIKLFLDFPDKTIHVQINGFSYGSFLLPDFNHKFRTDVDKYFPVAIISDIQMNSNLQQCSSYI